ncbi:MAG: CAP domain-containing protein [Solirubrobacteraceae bacterium MAG38_C4-C5]|nr:CAP domain-containing protein [Candidatus Siliceabacter maunaloa]
MCSAVLLALGFAGPVLAASEPSPQRAVEMLNEWRGRVGLGAVTLDPANTEGCRQHAEYYRLNGTTGHSEDPSRPGYTVEGDRAAGSSVLAYDASISEGPYAWEEAPYHRTSLLAPRLAAAGFWAEHGLGCMGVFNRNDAIRTAGVAAYPYPHHGQTGVEASFDCFETPNPCTRVPGNDGETPIGFVPTVNLNGPWSHISGPEITSASLRPDRGSPVAITIEDRSDPRGAFLDGGFSMLPHEPLRGGTWYTASARGVLHGSGADEQMPFDVSWRFQTQPRFPAKLKVERASIRGGVLDALLSVTGRATGEITVDYQAAGRFTRYTVDVGPAQVGEKQVRLVRELEGAQRRRSTGILNIGYDGNGETKPDVVRVRAANGRSRLTRETLTFADGRLRVTGAIDDDVAGIVRLRATYLAADGSAGVWEGRAPVLGGRWSVDSQLPAAVAADPNAYLTIQFTGDLNAPGGPYRGEQDGKGLGNL